MTSQPSLSGIVAATAHTERGSELSLDTLLDLEPYWTEVRATYAPFETGLLAPTGRVYRHEMPGGQLSNLRQQAEALGLGDRFEEVELAYARANEVLGHIVKVTPTSKVVGDLALFVVSGNIDWEQLERHPERFDLPDSVLDVSRRAASGSPRGGCRSRSRAGRCVPVQRRTSHPRRRRPSCPGGRGRPAARRWPS